MSDNEYRLTEVNEVGAERRDDEYGNDTADLVAYGLRQGCLDSEYALANRLQQLRHLAVGLANTLDNLGYGCSEEILELIDVQKEVSTTKRFSLDRRG